MERKNEAKVTNSFWVYSITNDKWTCFYKNENNSSLYWNKKQSEEPRPRYAHQLVYDESNRVCTVTKTLSCIFSSKSVFWDSPSTGNIIPRKKGAVLLQFCLVLWDLHLNHKCDYGDFHKKIIVFVPRMVFDWWNLFDAVIIA